MDISGLADADLAEIFKHLPLYDRLIVSEVCRRWYSISALSWVDISHADFSLIPCENIGAIVKRCPNLQSVFAVNKHFAAKVLHCLCQAPLLSSLKFYGCKFEIDEALAILPVCFNDECLANIFSDGYERKAWSELILQELRLGDAFAMEKPRTAGKWELLPLPGSLRRLQLGGLRSESGDGFYSLFFFDVQPLPNLECFILSQPTSGQYVDFFDHEIFLFRQIVNLNLLRELYIDPVPVACLMHLAQFVAEMPQLAVLFLNDVGLEEARELAAVITRPSALRILVISGFSIHVDWQQPIEIPARKRFPNGFDGPALGELNVCLRQAAANKMSFADSALVNIHLIGDAEPMWAFLARPDIAPIFKGVWIAAQIKECASVGNLGTPISANPIGLDSRLRRVTV